MTCREGLPNKRHRKCEGLGMGKSMYVYIYSGQSGKWELTCFTKMWSDLRFRKITSLAARMGYGKPKHTTERNQNESCCQSPVNRE